MGNILDSASKAVTALGLLGLLIYVVVRRGYEAFYAEAGVTPEDVGLSEAAIVTHAALGLVSVGLVIALVAIPIGLSIWSVFPGVREHPGLLVLVAGAVIGLLFSLAAAIFTYVAYGGQLPQPAPSMPFVLLFPLIVLLISADSLRGTRRIGLRPLGALAAVGLAVAGLGLISTANTYGAANSHRLLQRSGAPESLSSIFDFRLHYVCVAWVGSGNHPPGLVDHPLVYFGRSDGQTILYRREAPWGTLRIPSASIVLTPAGDRELTSGCSAT